MKNLRKVVTAEDMNEVLREVGPLQPGLVLAAQLAHQIVDDMSASIVGPASSYHVSLLLIALLLMERRPGQHLSLDDPEKTMRGSSFTSIT
ncbi:hypothetical protein ACJZ2D_007598 [Fusarium nematophilum]